MCTELLVGTAEAVRGDRRVRLLRFLVRVAGDFCDLAGFDGGEDS
jgi:hypothetical protein